MKKIILLHHVSSLGGGTKSLFDVALMLKGKYDVIIAIPKGSDEIVQLADSYGISCYEILTPIPSLNIYSGHPSYLSRYFWNTLIRFRNNKLLVEELMVLKPDCIFYNTSVTALIAKDVPKTVVNIGIVRETFTTNPLNRLFKSVYNKYFSGVAYIASHEKNYLNLSVSKQIVVPDCLEPSEIIEQDRMQVREQYHLTDEHFVGLFMGGTTQIKGLDVLLKAIELLNDNSVFFVSGKVDYSILTLSHILKHFYQFKYIRFLISVKRRLPKLIKEGKVKLTGFTKDIAPFMSMCDVLIFPSTAAHQPRPAIEAGNFGKPVLISDFEATREYFQDGYNALTFVPRDAKSLADKLRYLKNNSDIANKLGENNRKASQEWHNFDDTQEALIQFFDDILE